MNRNQLKVVPVLLVFFAVLMRLVPHPANFAPIGALGLFGVVYLPKKFGFVLPMIALLVSDLFLGFYGMTMLFVYGSFLLSGVIGLYIRKHKSFSTVLVGSLLSSVLFFLITNFGVWVNPVSAYAKTIDGLLLCYAAAIPFFRNSLVGDMFYVGMFFGGIELLRFIAQYYHLKHTKWI